MAVDGEKIKANANYKRSKNRKRTKQSYERVKEAVARALGKPVNEDFTEEKKAARLEKFRGQEESLLALKAMLEDMDDEEATVNITDPGAVLADITNASRAIRRSHGFLFGWSIYLRK